MYVEDAVVIVTLVSCPSVYSRPWHCTAYRSHLVTDTVVSYRTNKPNFTPKIFMNKGRKAPQL